MQNGRFGGTRELVFDDELYKLMIDDAPGGTGKTFICNLLLAAVRKDRKIGVATESSGIAAILLRGGRTAHCRWKIPINALMEDRSSVTTRELVFDDELYIMLY